MSAFAARLALLQLPLVYLVAMVFGLALYGSEFDTPQGTVYQVTLPLVVVVGLLPARRTALLARAARPAALIGIALSAWAYRPLHFAWWDERSLEQAWRLAALGVVTAVVAAGARAQLEAARARARDGLAPALLAVAAVWITALWQPMMPFLGLTAGFALVLAVGLPRAREASEPEREEPVARVVAVSSGWMSTGWIRYGALLAGLDLSLVAWDWQTLPAWASPLASGFAAAAIVAWLWRWIPERGLAWLAGAWGVSFVVAAFLPAYALTHLHAELAGALLGALLASGGGRARGLQDGSLPYWALLGFLPAHLATQHLAFASLRVALLLPCLAFLRTRGSRPPATRAPSSP